MRNIFVIKLLLVFGSVVSVIGKLPPTIPLCSRNHPNLSECMINVFKVIQPRLNSGDLGPGLRLPALEPLVIPQIQIGDKSLQVLFSNIQIHGASKVKIEKLRVNYNDLKIDLLLTVPKLNIFGKYKLGFNFLNQLVKSDGDCITEFQGSKIKVGIKGNRYVRNGQEYAHLQPIDVKFQRGKVINVKLTNLFPENPVIGEVINTVLNNDPDFALKSFYPQINNYLSKFATEIVGTIFETNSLDELFPQ